MKKDFFIECINQGFKQAIIVDTENVGSVVFKNLNMFTKEDTIILMETPNSMPLRYSTVCKLLKTKAKIEYQDILDNETGVKNALDFKIVALATEILCTRKKVFITIISEDKGYDSAISYLKDKRNIPWIRRCSYITSPRDLDLDKELEKLALK